METERSPFPQLLHPRHKQPRAHAQRHARHRGLSDRRWVTRLPLHLLHGYRRLSTPPSLCPAELPRVPAEAHLLFQENVTVNAAKVTK